MDEGLPIEWLTSVSTKPLHPWCLELRVRPGTISYIVVQPISKTIHDPLALKWAFEGFKVPKVPKGREWFYI